jgi:hypothetical protein
MLAQCYERLAVARNVKAAGLEHEDRAGVEELHRSTFTGQLVVSASRSAGAYQK